MRGEKNQCDRNKIHFERYFFKFNSFSYTEHNRLFVQMPKESFTICLQLAKNYINNISYFVCRTCTLYL